MSSGFAVGPSRGLRVEQDIGRCLVESEPLRRQFTGVKLGLWFALIGIASGLTTLVEGQWPIQVLLALTLVLVVAPTYRVRLRVTPVQVSLERGFWAMSRRVTVSHDRILRVGVRQGWLGSRLVLETSDQGELAVLLGSHEDHRVVAEWLGHIRLRARETGARALEDAIELERLLERVGTRR